MQAMSNFLTECYDLKWVKIYKLFQNLPLGIHLFILLLKFAVFSFYQENRQAFSTSYTVSIN